MKQTSVMVYGAGAIGIAIGASLYSEGLKVSFFAREATAKAINEGGVLRKGLFGEKKAPAGEVKAYSDLAEVPEGSFDFILVSTKTTANRDAAKNLYEHRNILKENGRIVILQNGWGNDEPFLEYFDKDTIFQARVITGFTREERNVSRITVHTAPILFGSLYGRDTAPLKVIADAINASGIESAVTDTLSEALWAKMLYNTTLNPLGAILNVPYGKLADSEGSRAIMNRLIDETYKVMEAYGYKSFSATAEDYKKIFYDKLIPDTREHRSSTLQDIERKIHTEIDTLNGCIVRMAEKKGFDAPTHRMICELIHAIEDNF